MAEPTIDAATYADLEATAGEDFVRELVDTFLEEAPLMLDALRAALAAGNADAFRRAAHSLKSNSDTFGAFGLGALARELELKGLAHVQNLQQAQPASAPPLQALDDEYARVALALKERRDA
jgi:HPt (histidine-containing phosphotransfer) domain-containing protein